MEKILWDYIGVKVEVITVFGSGSMHNSKFLINNPFHLSNHFKPLPYPEYDTRMFNNIGSYNEDVYCLIEEEITIVPPALDLKRAFNCFNNIPSSGASYSIKLCVDVPNNKKPELLVLRTDSEIGHSFIVVTKSNGAKTITQVFGFYAKRHPGYLFPFREMPSVIRNNNLREINASIEMSLTEKQFELLREKALELAKHKFNAASYNCTDYGLNLFNSLRSQPINIDTYTVYLPNNNNFYGTAEVNQLPIERTPQRLFKKLKEMKNKKDKESSSILINQTDTTKAPRSHGECD